MADEKTGIFYSNNMNGLSNNNGLQRPWLHQEAAMPAIQFRGSLSSEKAITTSDGESEDTEQYCDVVLKYISDMLMDENMEEKMCMYQECSALQATVKPFYDILGENYPPQGLCNSNIVGERQKLSLNYYEDDAQNKIEDSSWIGEFFNSQMPRGFESPLSANPSPGYSSQYSFSFSGSSTVIDGLPDSTIYELSFSEFFSGSKQGLGVGEFEEVIQVVPKRNFGSSVENGWHFRAPKKESDPDFQVGKREDAIGVSFQMNAAHSDNENEPKRQKDPHREDLDLEDRQSNKLSAVYSDNVICTEGFHKVLLCVGSGLSNNNGLQRPWLHQEAAMPATQFRGSLSSEKAITTSYGESEDTEQYCDVVLKYISDMLMDENMEEKMCMYQECSALQATVKPFYDILGENYPPQGLCNSNIVGERQKLSLNYYEDDAQNKIEDSSWIGEFFNSQMPRGFESPLSANPSAGYSSQYSFSFSGSSTVIDGLPDSTIYELSFSEFFSGSKHGLGAGEFEEVIQVVPKRNFGSSVENGWHFRAPKKESDPDFQVGKREDAIGVSFQMNAAHSDNENEPKRQKDPHREDLDLEDRQSNKLSAVYSDNVICTEGFHKVLLCVGSRVFLDLQQEILQNGVQKSVQSGSVKGLQCSKSRARKQGKMEVVDLRALLLQCAQAVATDDTRGANEILKQIRQHASPYGDGTQRLANYFANGLVARLSGSGGTLFTTLSCGLTSAADILKAYQLYLVAVPYRKMSHFLSYRTVLNVAEKSTRLHIVHFGIVYGFQWPSLIQCLANRPGGPPMLRITGIDFPQPGFRAAERIEETGRRLADYAKSFGVPFEYHAIATKKWEDLDIEELSLRSDEVLVVNCMYRFKNLLDETVVVESPRDIVLNKIRSMNPRVFIHGVENGAHNAPFFITRFREALFHYSALFDIMETIIPRDNPQRFMIEKEIFGRIILNVVACEGLERVERPETYKQWQVRIQRAGFVQLPLDRTILSTARDKVKSFYHKDFVVDKDGKWMLFGWKGRISYAVATWRPST